MRGSTSPSKHVVKFSIMPLASRHLERETVGITININQQLSPRSCVNPALSPCLPRGIADLGLDLVSAVDTADRLDRQQRAEIGPLTSVSFSSAQQNTSL